MGLSPLDSVSTVAISPREDLVKNCAPDSLVDHAQVGADLLADWDNSVSKFVRVMPTDYKAVLEKMKAEEALEATAA